MKTLAQMKRFMEPKSVAIIGSSRDTGEWSFNILEHLLTYGYQGKLYPVNPNASEILGLKSYASVSEITSDIDLAIISTPRVLTPQLVKECSKHGIHAITVIGQGFNDASDSQGKQLQKEIDDVIKNSQTRVLGPNTLGTANAYINFSSSFSKIRLEKNHIGLICQTGVFFVGFAEVALTGKGIDLGNACDINFVDGLEYFEQDAETKAVALHIEGTKDTSRLIDIAKRITPKKPLIVLKTGKGQQAARAAKSHTGSLTGSHEIWSTALKQAGVIQASDLEELIDLTRAFSILPLMKNQKVGVATISGGLGIITLDGCQNSGLEIGKLSPETQEKIEAISPQWLKVGNPVDFWPTVMASPTPMESLIGILETLLADRKLDAVMLIIGSFNEKWDTALCQSLNGLATAHPDKPLTTCIYGPYGDEAIKGLQAAGKVAAYPTPERAIRALARLYEYSQLQNRL
jgi:acetyltransferase